MTVPKGVPKNVEWADHMRQALQIAGSNLGVLEDIFRPNRLSGGEAFNGLKNALRKLDEIADEIAAFDMPEHSCSGRACVHCKNCGHEAHGFVQEFLPFCGYNDKCQCRGM